LVGILNPKNKLASMLFGKQIIEQNCAHTTKVQTSCRTWCEPNTNFLGCHAAKIGGEDLMNTEERMLKLAVRHSRKAKRNIEEVCLWFMCLVTSSHVM
jgi:hypothetical protein